MFVLLTILVLVAAPVGIGVLTVFSPQRSFTWVIATAGALAAWVLTLLWQVNLPATLTLTTWQPNALFAFSPTLRLDGISWLYGVSLVTLCMGVILTMPARMTQISPLAASGNMLLTALGLFAVLSDNPLTLVLAWSAIDLAELSVMLRSFNRAEQSEAAVIGFAARVAGTGLVLWGSALSSSAGAPLSFETVPDAAVPYLLLGVGLRLGVMPLNLPFAAESSLRRGFGTILRLVSAASSLVLLARLPQVNFEPTLETLILLGSGVTALFGAWRWARGNAVLDNRPYWVISMGALALAADVRGSTLGSAAWGSALVLAGGALFIFSHEVRWLKWVVAASVFGISALPFSLTSTGWLTGGTTAWWFLLLLIPTQVLLITGFMRFALAPQEPLQNAQPQGAQSVYPVAFILMTAMVLTLGLWGWDGAAQVGAWIPGLVAAALSIGLVTGLSRLQTLVPVKVPSGEPVRQTVNNISATFGSIFWGVYRLIRQLLFLMSQTLEGDGGMLWAFVLLVLLINLFRGGQ